MVGKKKEMRRYGKWVMGKKKKGGGGCTVGRKVEGKRKKRKN